MAYKLVVVHPFGNLKRGDAVTDQAEVAKHLRDRAKHFVKVLLSDAEAKALVPAKAVAPAAPAAAAKA